jgi:hypothetical protein
METVHSFAVSSVDSAKTLIIIETLSKRLLRGMKVGVLCTIQKQDVRVQPG